METEGDRESLLGRGDRGEAETRFGGVLEVRADVEGVDGVGGGEGLRVCEGIAAWRVPVFEHGYGGFGVEGGDYEEVGRTALVQSSVMGRFKGKIGVGVRDL